MLGRVCLILMFLSATAVAQPATAPSTQPARRSFPTPTELVEKLRQRRAEAQAKTKVAFIELSESIVEQPSSFALFTSTETQTLRDLLTRLKAAEADETIRAVLITLGAKAEANIAQAQEIRDAFADLRRAGKRVFVYADAYETVGYLLACGATDVCMAQGGEIMIPGIGMETMFYKGAFDKIGVTADYVQIGEFKGAEEPYTRTAPSEELKGEMNRLSEALFTQIVEGISLSRGLTSQVVRQMIDEAMMTARVAKDRGFVDHLVEIDGLRGLLKTELGNEIDLVVDYGEPEKPELDLSNPFALLATLNRQEEPTGLPQVAVIYVDGVITDGDGGTTLLGEEGVGSDTMRRDLRLASRDENIKAIVLRIDSPGGSALASEVIWQSIRRIVTETKKPVVVSIGSMAASGGYYLASAGDYIFADRSAIIGSIGVVGGKFVLKDLYDKLGVTTETFTQGRNAALFSSTQKFDERQRRMIRNWMQQTYDQFTQRVMTTRAGKIKDIDQVARGRIFLAQQARELGMVDELGGSEAAIAYAADKAGLKPGEFEVRTLPAPQSLADLLMGRGADAATAVRPSISISPDSALLSLAPSLRRSFIQQMKLAELLQQRPVVLMAPFTVRME